jgi:hypothetical protein
MVVELAASHRLVYGRAPGLAPTNDDDTEVKITLWYVFGHQTAANNSPPGSALSVGPAAVASGASLQPCAC